jgi:hypothetical protein
MLRIGKYINYKVFLLSLIVGLFLVYMTGPERRSIFVYPTKENSGTVQFKDSVGNCYAFDAVDKPCPKDPLKISYVPAQL